MNDIEALLAYTEKKYLRDLYEHTKALFKEEPIPSHNEEHHLRVWKYASAIVTELSRNSVIIGLTDLENLIISAFFHDTGLIYDNGPRHGRSGALLCKQWLEERSPDERIDPDKILHAIENHDNKEYSVYSSLITEGRISIPAVLNVCDDLDAFGITGIYRYSEIYLLRGISPEDLGNQVLSNVSCRFINFMKQCQDLPSLIEIHTPRYRQVKEFFEQYNKQLTDHTEGESHKSGPYAIVMLFYRHISEKDISLETICDSGMREFKQGYEREFFEELCGPARRKS